MCLVAFPLILTDTAGLRAEACDEIEVIGMQRARSEAAAADIVVWVSSVDVAEDIENAVVPALKILNKSDLPGDASVSDLKFRQDRRRHRGTHCRTRKVGERSL